jgi:hypothetical protein
MIPTAFLQAWSVKAPWPDLRQVEQDLIICRALCDLFNAPALAGKLAFRGGTAIHKLLFAQALRYSEDIDLVQTQPEPIGGTVDAIRAALSWLGGCSREQAGHSMHLVFKFRPEVDTQATLKLKVEINTREHGNLLGVRRYPFAVDNGWYRGATEIVSFEPEELFGTKLRAMLEKLTRSLTEDVAPMLPAGVRWNDADAIEAFGLVWTTLVARLEGDGWKRSEEVIERLRADRYPALLRPRASSSR